MGRFAHNRAFINLMFTGLVLVFVMGAVLRVRRLTYSPGWFRDEGTYMETAWQVVKGSTRLGPLNHTWVSPFQTHPPFYFITTGVWMHVIGAARGDYRPNIQPFRWASAGCGLLCLVGIFLLGRRMGSPLLGLLAAAIYAFDPMVVMFNRMGLPYNMLAVEVILTALLMDEYFEDPARLWPLGWAATVAALATLTVYYAVVVPMVLLVVVLVWGRRRMFWIPLAALVPLGLFFAGLWAANPLGLAEDWAQFRADALVHGDLRDWLQDLHDLIALSPLCVLGLLGLTLLPRGATPALLQLVTLAYLAIVLQRANNQLALISYPVIPVLPFFALGTAQCIIISWRVFRGDAFGGVAPGGKARYWIATAGFAAVVAIILLGTSAESIWSIYSNFKSPLADHLAFQKPEVEAVAEFFWNQGLAEDDLVLAEYPLWWMLPGRHATLTQAVAYQGGKTDFFRYPINPKRFAYDCSLEKARYVVLDDVTRFDRAGIDPDLARVVSKIEHQWTPVFWTDRMVVYEHPGPAPSPTITDPFTGEVIDVRTGKVIGHLASPEN